jgi:hypothetical protein
MLIIGLFTGQKTLMSCVICHQNYTVSSPGSALFCKSADGIIAANPASRLIEALL